MSKKAKNSFFEVALLGVLFIGALVVATPVIAQQPVTVETTIPQVSPSETDLTEAVSAESLPAELPIVAVEPETLPNRVEDTVPSPSLNTGVELSTWERMSLVLSNSVEGSESEFTVNSGAELSMWEKLYLR